MNCFMRQMSTDRPRSAMGDKLERRISVTAYFLQWYTLTVTELRDPSLFRFRMHFEDWFWWGWMTIVES